jgi:hypothetical protein
MAVYDRDVVSTLTIRLLGPPEIERDGEVAAPPRGHKAWAVLAYLVLAERPVGRARVAFSGRIGRRALRPGAYRLIVTAVDAAGNRSTDRPTRFKVAM